MGKIESAEAPGADVAELVARANALRASDCETTVESYERLVDDVLDALERYAGAIAEHNKRLRGHCDERKRLGMCTIDGGACHCPVAYMIEAGK